MPKEKDNYRRVSRGLDKPLIIGGIPAPMIFVISISLLLAVFIRNAFSLSWLFILLFTMWLSGTWLVVTQWGDNWRFLSQFSHLFLPRYLQGGRRYKSLLKQSKSSSKKKQ
ncbi:MAG: hypothetical protein F6K47_03995 [Symploca sp. SIO2E6]|nr:hypothetical protein [Symploca sp. SIO2E6]